MDFKGCKVKLQPTEGRIITGDLNGTQIFVQRDNYLLPFVNSHFFYDLELKETDKPNHYKIEVIYNIVLNLNEFQTKIVEKIDSRNLLKSYEDLQVKNYDEELLYALFFKFRIKLFEVLDDYHYYILKLSYVMMIEYFDLFINTNINKIKYWSNSGPEIFESIKLKSSFMGVDRKKKLHYFIDLSNRALVNNVYCANGQFSRSIINKLNKLKIVIHNLKQFNREELKEYNEISAYLFKHKFEENFVIFEPYKVNFKSLSKYITSDNVLLNVYGFRIPSKEYVIPFSLYNYIEREYNLKISSTPLNQTTIKVVEINKCLHFQSPLFVFKKKSKVLKDTILSELNKNDLLINEDDKTGQIYSYEELSVLNNMMVKCLFSYENYKRDKIYKVDSISTMWVKLIDVMDESNSFHVRPFQSDFPHFRVHIMIELNQFCPLKYKNASIITTRAVDANIFTKLNINVNILK